MYAWQDNRAGAVIQVVNVDDLRVRILNVRYGKANSIPSRVSRCSEAGNRNDQGNRHKRLIGLRASFR